MAFHVTLSPFNPAVTITFSNLESSHSTHETHASPQSIPVSIQTGKRKHACCTVSSWLCAEGTTKCTQGESFHTHKQHLMETALSGPSRMHSRFFVSVYVQVRNQQVHTHTYTLILFTVSPSTTASQPPFRLHISSAV